MSALPQSSELERLMFDAAAPRAEPEEEVVGLFDRLRGRILRYVLGFGLPVHDAEEVVQDVFLALHQHLSRGKPRIGVYGWLFRVSHNLSLKRRTALARSAAPAADAEGEPREAIDPGPNPEDQLFERQRQDRLRSVYRALPEIDRRCLFLRSEGLRYREIAGVLGISVGSVANSMARSLTRLAAVDGR